MGSPKDIGQVSRPETVLTQYFIGINQNKKGEQQVTQERGGFPKTA